MRSVILPAPKVRMYLVPIASKFVGVMVNVLPLISVFMGITVPLLLSNWIDILPSLISSLKVTFMTLLRATLVEPLAGSTLSTSTVSPLSWILLFS